MPWNRNDPPDPIEVRRRQLEEQQRALSEQRQRLHDELHGRNDPAAKPVEPPVWRMDEEQVARPADPTPARKRHLARQRQRDMILAFIFIGVLLIVLLIVFIIAYVHTATPASAA